VEDFITLLGGVAAVLRGGTRDVMRADTHGPCNGADDIAECDRIKGPRIPALFPEPRRALDAGIDERANGRLWNIGAVKIGLIPL
jgi:hypothetical protein